MTAKLKLLIRRAWTWLKCNLFIALAALGAFMVFFGIWGEPDANRPTWMTLKGIVWGVAFSGIGIAGVFRELRRCQEIARQKIIHQLRGDTQP